LQIIVSYTLLKLHEILGKINSGVKARRNNTYIATDRWMPVHIPRALPLVVSPWLLQARWLTLLEIASQEPDDNPVLLAICTREDRVGST